MSTTRRIARSTAGTLAVLLTAAVLAACGGGDDETAAQTGAQPGAQSGAQPAAAGSFNPADVLFAQQMIPHHSQAVKMASLAAGRAKSPQVKKLAAEIVAAQGPEIETMQGFLEAWGKPLIPDMADMDHSSMTPEEMTAMTSGEMPGMAPAEELTALEAAKGKKFDRLFLAMMLEHHQGAVEMAQAEQSDGQDPAAIALAEEIESAQTAEIVRIEKLQDA